MWGKHLILDCSGCDPDLIASPENIKEFVGDLVAAIDMKAVGDPVIQYLNPQPHLAGHSLMQLIETSSITGHFCDESCEAYIDIFSCKDFDHRLAIDVVEDFFNPDAWIVRTIERMAPGAKVC